MHSDNKQIHTLHNLINIFPCKAVDQSDSILLCLIWNNNSPLITSVYPSELK